ncbi:MAG: hydroxyacid dehydrogenase [Candidatus Thorarchaeota archaeon]
MRILIADPITASAVESLKKDFDVIEQHFSPSDLLDKISDFHAIIVRSSTKIPREVIEKAGNLKVIGRAGVGVDNIDVEAATKRGIFVVNSPRASTISVAEITIGYMLALSRSLVQATKATKLGKWPKKQLKGIELFGKTLGFVGCGRIGAEVAKRAQVFGMSCLVYDPYLPPEVSAKIGVEMTDDLNKLCEVSDFITIHAWLTDETRGMISKKQLEIMKPTAFLVNCARGGIIDEGALYEALKTRKIAGAALDVFSVEPAVENILFGLDNLYVSPHIAASTKEAQERAGQVTAEQVRLALTGKTPEFCVNPQVSQ